MRERMTGTYTEIKRYEQENDANSSGLRIVFWKESIAIFTSALLVGHGTGSIMDQFQRAAEGQTGASSVVSTNPHDQTFAVGIQLGLLGIALLWAMWISQLMLFRGSGIVAWIGIVVVTTKIVGSLFNSFIFDFTKGWLYVLGVDIVGGLALTTRAAEPAAGAAP
jgi:O-antigen ligase